MNKITPIKQERYGFVCDCDNATFLLCTNGIDSEVICSECGFTHEGIKWYVANNGEKVESPVINLKHQKD